MRHHMIKDKNSHNLKKPKTGVTMPKQKPTLYSGKLSDVYPIIGDHHLSRATKLVDFLTLSLC